MNNSLTLLHVGHSRNRSNSAIVRPEQETNFLASRALLIGFDGVPSVMSFIMCRVKPFQSNARIFAGELPVSRRIDSVPLRLPGAYFAAQLINRVNSAIQALTHHDTDLRFSDIQPTAMLGRVHEFEPVPKRFGNAWLKHLVQRIGTIHVQIIHHQSDGFRRPIALCNVAEKLRKVTLGAPFRHLRHSRSGQWLCRHKHIASPHATVFIVNPAWLPRTHRQRLARLANQLCHQRLIFPTFTD